MERRSTVLGSVNALDVTAETIFVPQDDHGKASKPKRFDQIKKYHDPYEDWFMEHHDFKMEKTPSPMKKNFIMMNNKTVAAFK